MKIATRLPVTYRTPREWTDEVPLTYDTNHPLEIVADFGEDRWVIGRDVLAAAVAGMPPWGDQTIMWTDDGLLWMELRGGGDASHPDQAILTLPADAVGAFLYATTQLVPYGSEGHLIAEDIDADLERLLSGGDRP